MRVKMIVSETAYTTMLNDSGRAMYGPDRGTVVDAPWEWNAPDWQAMVSSMIGGGNLVGHNVDASKIVVGELVQVFNEGEPFRVTAINLPGDGFVWIADHNGKWFRLTPTEEVWIFPGQ